MQRLIFSDVLHTGSGFDCTAISESMPRVISFTNDLPTTKMPVPAIAKYCVCYL